MRLEISRYDDMYVTKLYKPGVEPAYINYFTFMDEVERYICQVKLVYPDLEVCR